MKNKNEATKGFHRLAAFMTYYHMIAGLLGLMITFLLLRKLPIPSDTWVLFFIQTILFCLVFYCGYAFMNKDYKRGIILSIFINVLQVIPFNIDGIGFEFIGGVSASLKYFFAPSSFGAMEFSLPDFNLAEAVASSEYFGVNFVALLILIGLFRMLSGLKKS
ncbi:MAG: hypothetical protein ABJM06_06440 [Gilvibacter sp.]